VSAVTERDRAKPTAVVAPGVPVVAPNASLVLAVTVQALEVGAENWTAAVVELGEMDRILKKCHGESVPATTVEVAPSTIAMSAPRSRPPVPAASAGDPALMVQSEAGLVKISDAVAGRVPE